MDKKHLFHTLTVICTWYTNNNWGFSSMQDYQRVFGSVWRRRRSADVSNAPKAQKLQDNFTQELRPPAAIINLYSCKGTRKHTTLKFGRNNNFCFCVFFLSKPPTLKKVKTLGRSRPVGTSWNTEGKSWMSSGRTWPRTALVIEKFIDIHELISATDHHHISPSPFNKLLYDDLGSQKNLYRKDV